MTEKTPTCPTCGIDLRYPTGLHVVDCPATQTDQTPSTEDVLRADPWLVRCAECGSKPGNACYGNGDMPKKLTHQSRLDASRRAALVAYTRAVKAEAWAEGQDAGFGACENGGSYTANPYRIEADRG